MLDEIRRKQRELDEAKEEQERRADGERDEPGNDD